MIKTVHHQTRIIVSSGWTHWVGGGGGEEEERLATVAASAAAESLSKEKEEYSKDVRE